MAAINDIFFGVKDGDSVRWYGTRMLNKTDLTPPIYERVIYGYNRNEPEVIFKPDLPYGSAKARKIERGVKGIKN